MDSIQSLKNIVHFGRTQRYNTFAHGEVVCSRGKCFLCECDWLTCKPKVRALYPRSSLTGTYLSCTDFDTYIDQ